MTKQCGKCKLELPESAFYAKGGSLRSYCIKCGSENQRQWRQANLDKVKIAHGAWVKANKEKIAATAREWHVANRNSVRDRNRDRSQRLRKEAIETLGAECSHCGISDIRVLHIDHIKGNGGEERKQMKKTTILLRIIKGIEGYQLLCANCHAIKTHENNEFNPR